MATTTEDDVQICPDNHRCENGSICVEHSSAEGKYFCDCEESALEGATVFSGLYCQHEATVYCTMTGEFSKSSFCTNQGTCKGNVDDNDEHLGCDCPKGYTGRHCQFIEGSEGFEDTLSMPRINSFKQDRGGDGKGLGTPGLVVIILLAVAILGAGLAFVIRRRRQHSTTHIIESAKSSDGHLHDADGENLEVPTKSFESDTVSDQPEITAVDSGHLA